MTLYYTIFIWREPQFDHSSPVFWEVFNHMTMLVECVLIVNSKRPWTRDNLSKIRRSHDPKILTINLNSKKYISVRQPPVTLVATYCYIL